MVEVTKNKNDLIVNLKYKHLKNCIRLFFFFVLIWILCFFDEIFNSKIVKNNLKNRKVIHFQSLN